MFWSLPWPEQRSQFEISFTQPWDQAFARPLTRDWRFSAAARLWRWRKIAGSPRDRTRQRRAPVGKRASFVAVVGLTFLAADGKRDKLSERGSRRPIPKEKIFLKIILKIILSFPTLGKCGKITSLHMSQNQNGISRQFSRQFSR